MTGRSWGADTFERLYAASDDPWRFETDPYERAKYAETLAALPEARIRNALELGCSIGVMSAALAARCDRLVCVDISARALRHAQARCAGMAHVRFVQAALPDGFPAPEPGAGFDLAVLSELLYFLDGADIDRLMDRVVAGCAPGAVVLLANWTGQTDTPTTGNEAARRARNRCGAAGLVLEPPVRHQSYRLDRMRVPG